MALTDEDYTFLQQVHEQFADVELEPDDPRREPLHDDSRDDPVRQMLGAIRFSVVESIQLFSGFRGSGKTTELFRLRRELEKAGALVLYADAMKYLNAAEPVVIADMLMVLAGAFGDALAEHKDMKHDIAAESFWDRLKHFLTHTEVAISGVEARTEYISPGRAVLGGISAGLNIKAEIKAGSSFRQNLQKFLDGHILALKGEVDAFIESGVEAIHRKFGPARKIVFIFDSLEQLRVNRSEQGDLIRGIEHLFTVHIDKLTLPYIHAIYTVPPWLPVLVPLDPPPKVLPTPHLWNNDPERSVYEPAWMVFRHLFRRRIDDAQIARLFGPGGASVGGPIDRLIAASAGQVRDLLRMMRDLLQRLTILPATADVVDSVIAQTRRGMLPLALDDAQWLREVSETRNLALASADEHSVERIGRFIDTHRVLYFVNDSAWYDVHPLIRAEIDRVIGAAAQRAAP